MLLNRISNVIDIRLLNTRRISICEALFCHPRPAIIDNGDAESSLWFTTLPHQRKNSLLMKQKKRKPPPKFVPKGPPIITCKHEKLNHFSGLKYENLDAIPLASKGWHHAKSKGDYFTIHPTTDHPAFLMTKSDLNTAAGTFEEAGVDPWLLEIITENGKLTPTTIQAKAIPRTLQGKNCLVVAETGCGKTLAYLLPMIQRVAKWRDILGVVRPPNSPLGVVIVPNRELALQVGTIAKELCKTTEIECQTILGGHTKQLMENPVISNVDILVATLGVLSKLTTFGQYGLRYCKHLVLDEADTLLDDSFSEKLVHFMGRFPIQFSGPEDESELPSGTQVTMVSATMPTSLDKLIGKVVSMDSLEKISTKYLHRVLPHVPQTFLRVGKSERPAELLRLVRKDISQGNPTMIFSNKTAACDWAALFLRENDVPCERINSRMNVDVRLGKYEAFRRGDVNVISCTDLTSRGIDTTRVKHVINFDFPLYMADYIHRCGRTGRIGHDQGCQITNLISSRREVDLLHEIELAARTFTQLHNVNNNIARIIHYRTQKNEQESEKKEAEKQLQAESN